jgi:hypothetical protein
MTTAITFIEEACVFNNLNPFQMDHRSVHLGLLKVDRIPPHLILTVGAKYFSLEKDRCVMNGDLPHLLRVLGRKGTRCVFVPLPAMPVADAIQSVNRAFHPFTAACDGVTCVRPIARFMADALGWETDGAETVFDLLEVISRKAMPTAVSVQGIETAEVTLRTYSLEDVKAYLSGL